MNSDPEFLRRPERKYATWFILVVNIAVFAFVSAYFAWSWSRPTRYVWDSDFDWWFAITFAIVVPIANYHFWDTNRRVAKAERYFANHPQLEDVRRHWRYN